MRSLPRISASERLGPEAIALLASLRSRSWEQLKNLTLQETSTVGPKGEMLSIFHDELPDGKMLVVVQTHIRGWLGFSQVRADGFRISRDGTITELRDEDLWDFT
jgi:hypothetical protein